MGRSLWIKFPTLLGAAACLWLLPSPWGWLLATLVSLLGSALLMAVVMHPNATFFADTRWRAPQTTDAVALTFDDGPHPEFTPQVLEVLAQRGVQAAFFVVGERVRQHPELVREIDAGGHLVCNHSDQHGMDFHFKLWRGARSELDRCNDAIVDATGREPALFRSPQGFKNPALGDVLRNSRMLSVGWQVRGRDAFSADANTIVRRIVTGARPGGVILLHDGAGLGGSGDRSATIAALPRIIDELRAKSMRFVRLDQLLAVEPYRATAS